MITYPISNSFSKKIFLAMFSALQYPSCIMNLISFFIDDFVLTSFQQKNEVNKEKYPN